MLRFVAAFAALAAVPALAQTVIDGSQSRVPADQIPRMIESVHGNVYMGPDAQLRGLHLKTSEDTTYVCGQALVNGAWQTFYFDIKRGSSRVGEAGDIMCRM
jgi:hypothetical protein